MSEITPENLELAKLNLRLIR